MNEVIGGEKHINTKERSNGQTRNTPNLIVAIAAKKWLMLKRRGLPLNKQREMERWADYTI